jgi:hypothetical protein
VKRKTTEPYHVRLDFGPGTPPRSWGNIQLDREDKGYYLGAIDICRMYFHVEAIEVKVKEKRIFSEPMSGKTKYLGTMVEVNAKNEVYQDRIDAWYKTNSDCTPHIVEVNKKKYFIHIEAYAA